LKNIKLLLTTPFMSYKDRWGQYYKGAGDTFPQGIGSIAGYLEKYNIPVDVLEPDIEGMGRESFASFIAKGNYDLIGISAFTTNIVFAYETARLIKSIDSGIRVVMGGSHPSIFPERTLEECADIDFIIVKEGEKPLLDLVNALSRNSDVSDVPNLFFRRNGEVIKNHAACDWLDLDELPMFPYHKFDMKKYVPAPSLRKVLPTFNYMAQRGCPYSCAFCDTRTHGKKVRYRSVDKVISDLKELKENCGVKGIIFEGSNFTIDSDWITRFCEQLTKERLNLVWYCMGRVDLDLDLLPLMKKAGLWCMSFGIESGTLQTLERMKKKISSEQVKAALRVVKKLNVRAIGSFILGYPGENEEDVRNTIEYACGLNLDVSVFFIPVPFPGTRLFDDAMESGGLKDNITWEDYVAWLDHSKPIYINPLLGEKHIDLYNYAFRKFYLRPRYIIRQLMNIRSLSDISRLLQGFKSIQDLIKKNIFPHLAGHAVKS